MKYIHDSNNYGTLTSQYGYMRTANKHNMCNAYKLRKEQYLQIKTLETRYTSVTIVPRCSTAMQTPPHSLAQAL